MNSVCTDAISETVSGMVEKFRSIPRGKACEIVTPFQYPDGSPIIVSFQPDEQGGYLLSDDGQASSFAFLGGASDIAINHRLGLVANRFRVDTKGQEIRLRAEEGHLDDALISMIGSIQDVAYLIYRANAQPHRRDFKSRVEQYLAGNAWPFERDVTVIKEPIPRKVNYVVHSAGPQQLYLLTYEPPAGGKSAGQLNSILVTAQEMEQQHLLGERAALAVLIDTGSTAASRSNAQAALEVMKNWHVPNLISWDQKDHLSDLLVAA